VCCCCCGLFRLTGECFNGCPAASISFNGRACVFLQISSIAILQAGKEEM
jgi:hypothetical protein